MMKADPAQIAIIQQVTGCTVSKAELVIRRLSEYSTSPTDTGNNNRFNISTQAAATWCGVSKHTFLKYANDYPAELPYLKMGIRFMFQREDSQAFIHRRIQGG